MTHQQKGWLADFTPPSDIPFDQLWTPEYVDERLKDAMRVVMRTAGSVGPAGHRNNMPDYYYEWADLLAQASNKDDAGPRNMVLVSTTQEQVGRMEEAIHWPAKYLADAPGPRGVLRAYLRAKAHRRPFGEECKRNNWARRTAYRARDKALAMIAMGLNRDHVPLR